MTEKPRTISIWDVTLRDGEQMPGVMFTPDQKVEIARALDSVGVRYADVAFPANSAAEREASQRIAGMGLSMGLNLTCRMVEEELDMALDLGIPEVNLMAPMSDVHIEKKFRLSRSMIRDRLRTVMKHASHRSVRVNFIGEDTARADQDFAVEMFSMASDLGADKLVLCDTVGVLLPNRMGEMVSSLLARVHRKGRFAVHCHNDYGLAVANTLAAVEAGVDIATVTVNGMGERAGNAALEQVVVALEHLHGVRTGIDLKGLYPLSLLVESTGGVPIAMSQPVVGHNAFRHESGIHVAAMLKHRATYESLTPESVGRSPEYVLGKHSGSRHVLEILERKSIPCTQEHVRTILKKVSQAVHGNGERTRFIESYRRYHSRYFGLPQETFWRIVHETLDDSASSN